VRPGPVLITGAHGQLGSVLASVMSGDVRLAALARSDLDVTDARAVDRVIADLRPAAVINCASYNDVDGAETNAMSALAVNAFAVQALARASDACGAVFVHYSTDFVFDGSATAPMTEADAPNPQSVYAASKLLGEWFALESPGAYVLRVESLFGGGAAFAHRSSLDKIVAALDRGDEVPVFVDRTVSPSHVGDIARATRALLEARPAPGLYHCVNTGAATWEAVAREAARQLGKEPRLRLLRMDDVKLAASRPRYCAMKNAKLAAAGIPMPSWQDALARTIAAQV